MHNLAAQMLNDAVTVMKIIPRLSSFILLLTLSFRQTGKVRLRNSVSGH